MDPSFVEFLKTLGQAAIFAYAAHQFYRDGRSQDKVFITHLAEQNKMLLAAIMQQTFKNSPAISPALAPWMANIPTDIGDPKVG